MHIHLLLRKVTGVLTQEGAISCGRLILNDIIVFFKLPYCLLRVYLFGSNNDLNASMKFAFSLGNGYLRPIQEKSEFLSLLKIVKDTSPKYILEIGTAFGGTLFLFTRIAAKDAHIASVDKQNWEGRGGYPAWKIPLFKSFALSKQKIFLFPTDSHAKKTIEEIKKVLNGKKLDFLFIDGDHSYEGVKMDFAMYSPLVREDGLIAFHDIESSEHHGVRKFWNEIKSAYKEREVIRGAKSNIGLIEMQPKK